MYKNGERMMAWVAKIDEIKPIEGADRIAAYRVGGWWVVGEKGAYSVNDLAIYVSIDSWIPTNLAPFLSKGKEPREFEGVKGERLRTVKLRGQISQGLLLPLSIVLDAITTKSESGDSVLLELTEGADVTELLGIKKWEKPIPPQLAGLMKGPFPDVIPRTDQERAQNLVTEIAGAANMTFEVTEKLEGSSMTCYLIDGEFGVCSRNIDLLRDENNAFWKVAIEQDIEAKMRKFGDNFAIQGELVGPGIQGNIYNLNNVDFFVFDVYDIRMGDYMLPMIRRTRVDSMGLKNIPLLDDNFILDHTVDELLALAEGKSRLAGTEREGIVFKNTEGGFSFKSISNRYLIKEQ